MKIIKRVASVTNQVAGTIALSIKDFWSGIEKFDIVVDITAINGSPTDVTIKFQELIDGVAVDSASITTSSTGTSRTTNGVLSVGNDAQLVVSFNGGTSPSVSFEAYVAGIKY